MQILIDEFHVTFFIPRDLEIKSQKAVRRTLNRPRFRAQLRQAVRALVRSHASLGQVRVTVSR